jgi:L-arabinonolactonase
MTKVTEIAVLQQAKDQMGESPLWVPETGCLWWVDIVGKAVRRLQVETGRFASFDVAVPPAALAVHEDGSVILAAGTGWYRLDSVTGSLAQITALEARPDGMGMTPDRGAVGRLYRLEGTRITEVLDGLKTQYGTAISPDARTFYLADSHPSVAAIWAFDFDVTTGTLSNRRLFHKPAHGRPDGATIDGEGCYWFAAIDAGQIVRLDPHGQPMHAIDLPVKRPTKPAFGGPDLTTLYVTTMRIGLSESQLAEKPLAGAVLAVYANVRGWPQPHVKATPTRSPAAAGVFENG